MDTARRRLLALAMCGASLLGATVPAVAQPRRTIPPAPCVESPLNERCPTWVSSYDNPNGHSGPEGAGEIAIAPDGSRAFTTGSSWDDDTGSQLNGPHSAGGYDIATVAFDPATGNQLWATRFNGTDDVWDNAARIEVSPDGSKVFVFGVTNYKDVDHQIVAEYLTIAYDAASGSRLWVSTDAVPGSSWQASWGNDLAIDPTGELIYVTGYAVTYIATGGMPGTSDPKITTIAYDADTGERLWASRDITGSAFSIEASPLGDKVFVTGFMNVPGTARAEFMTIAYEARDPARLGEPVWIARYDGGNQHQNIAYYLEVSPDGSSVYVTGRHDIRSETQGGVATQRMEYGTVAYDAETGKQRWSAVFAGPGGGNNLPTGVVVAPGGARVFVTGWSTAETPGDTALGTVAYDSSTGSEVWSSLHSVPQATFNVPASMAVAPGGGTVYVTGIASPTIAANAGEVIETVAYRTDNGQTTWSASYSTAPGAGRASPSSIRAMPNGEGVLVSGAFGSGLPVALPDVGGLGTDNRSDYALLRYAA